MNIKQMLKNLQEWLLVEGRCSGCGKLLEDARVETQDDLHMLVCDCRRVYIYNTQEKVYEKTGGYYQLESEGGKTYDFSL